MWDVFISHASEDKQFVRLLAKELKRQGLKVWFDEFTLQVGDSLRDKIDFGLANSKYGIVVLSKSFLAKKWPRRELNGLVSREDEGGKIILPVWHDISMEEVRQFSPILADKLAVTSEQGLEAVTVNLLKAIYLNQNSDWIPYEMQWPDNSTMVILPMAPIDNGAFCISKHLITNEQYKEYVSYADGTSEPIGEHYIKPRSSKAVAGQRGKWKGPFYPWRNSDFRDQNKPVVCVAYQDAISYCEWVNQKFSVKESYDTFLPNPRLWDLAALGEPFHHTGKLKPWILETQQIHHKSNSPAPIDISGERTNKRGISDMFGNIWEWCDTREFTYIYPTTEDPPIIIQGEVPFEKIELRGGGFLDDLFEIKPFIHSPVLKDGENTRHSDLGFRIAGRVPLNSLPGEVQIRLSLCDPI